MIDRIVGSLPWLIPTAAIGFLVAGLIIGQFIYAGMRDE